MSVEVCVSNACSPAGETRESIAMHVVWWKWVASCWYLKAIVELWFLPCFLLPCVLLCDQPLSDIPTALDWTTPSRLLCLDGLEPSESVTQNVFLTVTTIRYYHHRDTKVTNMGVMFYILKGWHSIFK